MNRLKIEKCLAEFPQKTVGVLGDFCLDAYWTLDPDWNEQSLETGKSVRRVVSQRYTPGGASNVVMNLTALGVGKVKAFGVLGADLFGAELCRQLDGEHADCTGLQVQEEAWNTSVFAKPHLEGEELNRFDFGTVNTLNSATQNALLSSLEETLEDLDVLIVNQQVPQGYLTGEVIESLCKLAQRKPNLPIIIDSRSTWSKFHNVILKINEEEALQLFPDNKYTPGNISITALEPLLKEICSFTNCDLVVTRGEQGMVVCEGSRLTQIPGIPVAGEIDTVGAGDTALAALAASIAAGSSLIDAGKMANLAASVTIKKLKQTGTATPEEILAVEFLENV